MQALNIQKCQRTFDYAMRHGCCSRKPTHKATQKIRENKCLLLISPVCKRGNESPHSHCRRFPGASDFHHCLPSNPPHSHQQGPGNAASLTALVTCGKQRAQVGEVQGKCEGQLDQDMATHAPLFTGPSLLHPLRAHAFFLYTQF